MMAQSQPEDSPESTQSWPKVDQSRPKVDPKSTQSQFKVGPKDGPKSAKKGNPKSAKQQGHKKWISSSRG